jgi:phenylacetic acid degradation operon negative regulatory protein
VWREGVWIRPDNIEILEEPRCTWLTARPDGDPVSLAADLFAPIEWAKTARVAMSQLARATQSLGRDPESGIASAFLAGAQALRHVRADPLLPDALLPADWPGAELRAAYLDYERRFHGVARAWFRQRSDRTR